MRLDQRRVLFGHRRDAARAGCASSVPDTGSLSGKKVLLVDDVADSGRTLDLVAKLLSKQSVEVRSVTIYSKPSTIIQPDYVWRTTDRWILFPWSAEGTVMDPKPQAYSLESYVQ